MERNGYSREDMWLPRVTSILQVVAKPGLLRYYAQQRNYMTAMASLQKAALRGTKIHEVCEQILLGNDVDIEPAIIPTIETFKKFIKEKKLKVIAVEKRVEDDSKNFYAGTIDLIAKVGDDIGIIDIKTGSGIFAEYSLQTAAYLNAYNITAKKKAKKRWILRIDQFHTCKHCTAKKRIKEGEVKITGGKYFCNHEFNGVSTELEFKELKGAKIDFKAFLNAKRLWEWQNKAAIQKVKKYYENNC